MSITAGGIKYYLMDDCDTLICKLENAIHDCDDNGYYDKAEKLEEDLDKLNKAFNRCDRKVMQEMLDKYHSMFKRYR